MVKRSLLLLLLAAGSWPALAQSPPSTSAARPSILYVVTDDQDPSFDSMPDLRNRLVDGGLTFANSFVPTPTCSPSRASVLTGLLAHDHGVLVNRGAAGGFERFRDLGLDAETVATWLHAAGYRTGLIGKYLNRYPGDAAPSPPSYLPRGWDFFAPFYRADRLVPYFDFLVNDNGVEQFYPARDEDYSTDAMARRALAFLDATPLDKPFFLWIAPSAPHLPAEPAPRHKGLYSGSRAPRVGAWDEEDVSDKPAYVRALGRITEDEARRIDKNYQARMESLRAVDEMLDALLRRLTEQGRLGETYVFFTSDNGYLQGQHRFPQGKEAPYEESIRVPLVVRGPGVPAGLRLPHMVLNVDLAATFAELAGARPGSAAEGRSLVPLLSATPPPESAWRADFLLEHWPENDDPVGVPAYAGLRSRDFKYVEYVTGERELYALAVDSYENNNLVGRSDQAETLQRLSARLAQLRNCKGEACR